ncbi:MAG: glycosyltransferase family 2 protein [Flavobacteriaceae bacterium]|nr:glycosyltransferase family 2 protein [Flavobacteriaceae bacterium]
MKLSVVIVNYNVRYFLELCLKSVAAAVTSIDAEIIIVDNNSSDESCKMVKQLFPNIRLIENKENVGFSKANNQGVAIAKGAYVCVLNPDTVVAEDSFTQLLDFSDSKNKIGIVSCKLIDGAGKFLPESKRNVPTRMVAIKKLIGLSKDYYVSNVKVNEIGKASVFVGAFMLLKRNLYEEVGGFDERYFMYGEDIDLSYSVLNTGYDNYYYGQTTVIHYKGESTLKDEVYAKRFYGAMQLFYKKYFKSNLLFDIAVGLGVRIIPIFKSVLREDKLEERPELTLETAELSFKEIIQLFEKQECYCNIHIKNTNFTIGSKSSKSRGEVVFVS